MTPPIICRCGRMRLPGRDYCGVHDRGWDDEANTELVQEMRRRMRERERDAGLA